MTVTVDQEKLARITTLYSGSHNPNGKHCAVEAAAYIAGEPWSDHPACVSPVIAAFMRRWNDDIPDDATRTRLLLPLIEPCVGTAGGDDLRLAWMCVDWLTRTHAPAWYRLTTSLAMHGKALASLPEITVSSWTRVKKTVDAARAAARDAAGDVAWDAAWDATGDAAWDAAWDAARAAAWDAAWDAARAAAWDAARAAAGDAAGAATRAAAWAAAGAAAWDAARAAAWAAAGAAAWDAAWDAARDALKPTTEALQAEAQAFVLHLCAVAKETQHT